MMFSVFIQNDIYFRSFPSAEFECYFSLSLSCVDTIENKLFELMFCYVGKLNNDT